MQKTLNYYNSICNEWNYTSIENESTGYESVDSQLRQLTKDSWDKADDAGKLAIESTAYNIYKSINLLPITYYSLVGFTKELTELSSKTVTIKNKTLGIGNNAGQSLSRFWFPNIQDAYIYDNKTVSLRSRFNHDAKLKRAIKLCYTIGNNTTDSIPIPSILRRRLELINGGTIRNFKTMNARAIYEYICPNMFGRILDFSSGYGGRMMGCLTSKMRYHYTGIDPNTKTFAGLDALGELLTDIGFGSGYEMHNTVSEEFDAPAGSFDAAFSSPPYFNLETYCDEPTQCMVRCTTTDAWFELYVYPTLKMLHKVLADSGVYAVNINDYAEYKIVDRWLKLSEKCNFTLVDELKMNLNVRPGVGNGKKDNGIKHESVFIFRKKV